MIAHASSHHIAQAESFLSRIEAVIIFPLIALIVGVALLVFLWGAFEFVRDAGSDAGRETGKRHMLYGIIGLLVILSAFSILQIATRTFGI